MRILIFFTLIIIGSINIYGQKTPITGIVIDEYLDPVAGARIMNSDSLILAITDLNGKFKIDITHQTNLVLISSVVKDWKSITIPINCNNLEVILQSHASYDFISLKKVNKLRRKKFMKLPELHKAAYEKGIFLSEKPCYEDRFIPNRW